MFTITIALKDFFVKRPGALSVIRKYSTCNYNEYLKMCECIIFNYV